MQVFLWPPHGKMTSCLTGFWDSKKFSMETGSPIVVEVKYHQCSFLAQFPGERLCIMCVLFRAAVLPLHTAFQRRKTEMDWFYFWRSFSRVYNWVEYNENKRLYITGVVSKWILMKLSIQTIPGSNCCGLIDPVTVFFNVASRSKSDPPSPWEFIFDDFAGEGRGAQWKDRKTNEYYIYLISNTIKTMEFIFPIYLFIHFC